MSYILDALRRADAERERGAVPGLHAKPLTIEPLPQEVATRRLPWLPIAIGGGIALVGLAGLAWWLKPGTVATPVPPAAVIAAAPMPMPAPPQPAVLLAPPAPPPVAITPPAAPPAPAKPPVAKIEKPPKPEKPAAKPAAPPAALATPLAQVPPDVRSQLPPMTVGGSIYSDSAASRFVMINGQIVREGEPAATGVVLERIGPKSAVLRWREWRIEVPL